MEMTAADVRFTYAHLSPRYVIIPADSTTFGRRLQLFRIPDS